MYKNVISFFLCLVCMLELPAQPLKKLSGSSYTVNEGLLVNRIVDLAEDKSGFMWVSTGAGLQRFKGVSFETVMPQQGLPETNHPHFFKLKDSTLWLSYYKGISCYNSVTDKFELIYENSISKKLAEPQQYEISPVSPVMDAGKAVWCWSVFDRAFIAVDKITHKVIDRFTLPQIGENTLTNFQAGDNEKLFFVFRNGISEIDFKSKKLLQITNFSDGNSVLSFSIFKNKILWTTREKIFETDISSSQTRVLSEYPVSVNTIEQTALNKLYENIFALSINNFLYTIDAESGQIQNQIVNEEDKSFVNIGYINACLFDHFQHLWIVTNVHGLVKINFNKQVIKYYGDPNVLTNFTRCIYPDKESNLIIAGKLFNNLSVYDTNQRLLKNFSIPPVKTSAQVSCIKKIGVKKYLLFLSSQPSAYILDAKNWKLSSLSFSLPIDYYSTLQSISDTLDLLFTSSALYFVYYAEKEMKIEKIREGFALCGKIDKENKIWIGATGKYSILNGKNFKDEQVFNLKENVVTKCFLQDKQGNMWMGTERGLYKMNGHTGEMISIYTKASGLADENIYSIADDENNNIWFSTNKGISCLTNQDKVFNIYESDGLQGSEYNGNSCAKAQDGELFFGGLNGFNSFYPSILKSIVKKPEIVLLQVKVMEKEWHGDTASWEIHSISLPYTKNEVSFSFTALGWYDPSIYNYQYKMDGIDQEWVKSGNQGYARYVLPPGNYVFEYSASNLFENATDYKKQIRIIITPPFWQTIWFRFLVVLIFILFVAAIVRFFDKLRYKKRLHEMELQQTVQKERQRISRDLHDNIGAYATVLLANTEQLKEKATDLQLQQSAAAIKENAKNIMSSLQETIWVLSNDEITFTDFTDRFKLYAKKIVQNFPEVQLRFNEQITNDKPLLPSEALHLFRIMQEALQNAVKHAHSSQIIISFHSDQNVRISIKDDGKGFDENAATNGNGLPNMKHRAEATGYKLKITSNAAGTEILLEKNNSFAV